jgi:hypothetical protein
MYQEELRLEILKAVFPVYKDKMMFMRIAKEIYDWVAPDGLESFKDLTNRYEKYDKGDEVKTESSVTKLSGKKSTDTKSTDTKSAGTQK